MFIYGECFEFYTLTKVNEVRPLLSLGTLKDPLLIDENFSSFEVHTVKHVLDIRNRGVTIPKIKDQLVVTSVLVNR